MRGLRHRLAGSGLQLSGCGQPLSGFARPAAQEPEADESGPDDGERGRFGEPGVAVTPEHAGVVSIGAGRAVVPAGLAENELVRASWHEGVLYRSCSISGEASPTLAANRSNCCVVVSNTPRPVPSIVKVSGPELP
jgi:hypothetical protein